MSTPSGPDPEELALPSGDPPARPKQAVVIVHGIGSQAPMSTLRSFVDAVWTTVKPPLGKNGKAETWSKHDDIAGSFELRRIATNEDARGVRTDFFEFYWAHLMGDTKLSTVLWWLKRLFDRGISRVPEGVQAAWWLGSAIIVLLALALVALGVLGILVLNAVPGSPVMAGFWLAAAAVLLLVLWTLRHFVLVEVVGDAARYLTPTPENIEARSRIRQLGMELLERLHKGDSYDRIVVVGHSLGSVVAYDIVSFYWSNASAATKHPKKGTAKADAVSIAAAALAANDDEKQHPALLAAYRAAQHDYFEEVRELSEGKWKISDFVTLGSPLAHAHFLMVNDREKLSSGDEASLNSPDIRRLRDKLKPADRLVSSVFFARAAQRELPLCPPLPDGATPSFLYVPPKRDYGLPHHAAPFAPVRWTNIYAPHRRVIWGDVIAGPLAPLFGAGVKDVKLEGAVASAPIAHTKYWERGHADDEHLVALRQAIDLLYQCDKGV